MNNEDVIEKVRAYGIDVVAISTMTGESKHYIKAAQDIKDHDPYVTIIAGGIHPTYYPQVVNEAPFDFICIGEGDHALPKFLDIIPCARDGGSCSISMVRVRNILRKLPGRGQRHDDPIEQANVRPLVADLDTLPHPDWGLVYDNTKMGQIPMKIYMTGRGCPFSCSYCWNRNLKELYKGKGKFVRKNSVDYVIEGLKQIRDRWPVSTFKFYDDMLIWKADDWAVEFSERYRREIGLPFFAFCRAELATEDVIRLLAEAGCRTLSMSIEAGNPRVREDLLNRRMTNDQIIDAHLIARKYGLKTFTNVILGIPDTKTEHDLESMDLAIRSKVDWGEYLIYEPFPGTWLGDYSVRRGYYKPSYDHMHSGYHYKSPLTCFTEMEKRIQLNMTTIGVVGTVLPMFRNLIVKHLLRTKPNKLFLLCYYVVKMYVIRRKLYPTKTTLRNSLRIYWQSFKQEVMKHTEEV